MPTITVLANPDLDDCLRVSVTITETEDPYGAPTWLVEASDGDRDWADTCFSAEEAAALATEIAQGVLDPWEDA